MEDVAQLRAMKAESSQTEVEGRLVKGCSITCDVPLLPVVGQRGRATSMEAPAACKLSDKNAASFPFSFSCGCSVRLAAPPFPTFIPAARSRFLRLLTMHSWKRTEFS